MKLRKKRQKIDFRGFFICHLRYCDVLITFSFFLGKITSNKNGKQTHPDDTFQFLCVILCAILFL